MSTDNSSKPGFAETIYSDAATFGVWWALFGAIFATIIGLVMIGFAIYIMTHKNTKTDVSAVILSINGSTGATCSYSTINNVSNYNCVLTLKYTYNNQEYKIDYYYNGDRNYYVGQTVAGYTDKKSPENFSLTDQLTEKNALVLFFIGLFIIAISWFSYFISKRFKFIAAAEGGRAFLNIVSGGKI
jgi:hypothetical protein